MAAILAKKMRRHGVVTDRSSAMNNNRMRNHITCISDTLNSVNLMIANFNSKSVLVILNRYSLIVRSQNRFQCNAKTVIKIDIL